MRNITPLGSRGFTMIEAVISTVIVGLVLVSSLNVVGSARRGQQSVSDRARGEQLAMDLLNEILAQNYMQFDSYDCFGLEPGKSNANRTQFTAVDDYHGWTESPLEDRSGNPLLGTTGWTRSVSVFWADPTTWAPTTVQDTGLKLIKVTVKHGDRTVASSSAYRSIAWSDTIPTPQDATSNHTPIAVLTSSRLTNRTSLTTTLTANTSSDADDDFLSYVWTFGDGTTGAGPVVTKTYNTIGTYTATVKIYDGRGGVATASAVHTVTP